jgi:antitoxin (DNA-binding transcriptional repressor) of toxin-antitoxin stability system
MHQIDMHEAKLHLADFIDIALGGEEIVIRKTTNPC